MAGRTSANGTNAQLNNLRLEIKSDINSAIGAVSASQLRLEKKFDDLEAGRLTRAEGNISDLRIEIQKVINQFNSKAAQEKEAVSTLSAKFVITYSIIGSIFVAVITALAYRVIVGAHP